MAAGQGFKTFATGDVLTASDVNGYLMQGVLVFASAAARTSAITSPQQGQVSFLKDTNVTQYYSGSAWVTVGGSSSPLTTKGDVYGYGTSDARIPIGTNGQVLTADSTQTLGLKWATPASGGMTTITSGTLSGTSLNLTSISGSYKHLQLEMYDVTWSTSDDNCYMTINGLTASNYSYGKNAFRNTTAGNYGTNAVASWDLNDAVGNIKSTGGRNHWSFTFFDYASSAYAPLMKGIYTFQSSNSEYSVVDITGTYSGLSAPITSIKFNTGSSYSFSGGTYTLYGVN
jgi:hypothetical protein